MEKRKQEMHSGNLEDYTDQAPSRVDTRQLFSNKLILVLEIE